MPLPSLGSKHGLAAVVALQAGSSSAARESKGPGGCGEFSPEILLSARGRISLAACQHLPAASSVQRWAGEIEALTGVTLLCNILCNLSLQSLLLFLPSVMLSKVFLVLCCSLCYLCVTLSPLLPSPTHPVFVLINPCFLSTSHSENWPLVTAGGTLSAGDLPGKDGVAVRVPCGMWQNKDS